MIRTIGPLTIGTLSNLLTAMLALLVMTGCGDGRPTRVPVAGRVIIDGKPLNQGAIRVLPVDARQASSTIGPDGAFKLTTFTPGDGCVKGTHRVEIIASEIKGSNRVGLVPAKYRDARTSDLSLTVSGPTTDALIELKWNGEAPSLEPLNATGDSGGIPVPAQ